MQHTIFVTAEDGSIGQYYLTFIANPSNADTLAAIYGDGELIEGFDANVFYYTYTLPIGTDHIPALTWDVADQWQQVTATHVVNTANKQTTQIHVVAGSGKKNIYTVEYEIALSSIDTLEMIYIHRTIVQRLQLVKRRLPRLRAQRQRRVRQLGRLSLPRQRR